jgi:replicative DNA helicase
MKKEIEDRLISSIRTPEDLAEIFTRGIDSSSFAIRSDIFDFIKKYNNNYMDVPKPEILTSQYPDFEYSDNINEKEKKFLIDEVKKSDVTSSVIKVINKGTDLLIKDPYGAIEYITGQLNSLTNTPKISKSFTDKDALKRLEVLKSVKEKLSQGGSIGIKTGLSIFDKSLLGWQPGNLVALVGRLGIGKSWVLEYLACSAYLDNRRIVYLSPEMTIQEVEARWDTIVSSMTNDVFPHEELVTGKINEKKYKEWLERISRRSDWLTMDSNAGKSFSISAIQSIVDEFQPDLLCLDGFLLMDNGAKNVQRWEAMLQAAYGLKAIAQNNKIVIIATTQATRDAANEMPELHQVYGGDSLMQAADIAIMIQKDEQTPMSRFITIPKVRGRKSQTTKIPIKFDVNNGKIGI